jgi:hypothetical protein
MSYGWYKKYQFYKNTVSTGYFEYFLPFLKIPLANARGSGWSELSDKHLPGDCDKIQLEEEKKVLESRLLSAPELRMIADIKGEVDLAIMEEKLKVLGVITKEILIEKLREASTPTDDRALGGWDESVALKISNLINSFEEKLNTEKGPLNLPEALIQLQKDALPLGIESQVCDLVKELFKGKYPDGKVEQYQSMLENLSQDSPDETFEIDFFDDHLSNMEEICNDPNITNKPTCFLVTGENITPIKEALKEVENKLSESIGAIQGLKRKYDYVVQLYAKHPSTDNKETSDTLSKNQNKLSKILTDVAAEQDPWTKWKFVQKKIAGDEYQGIINFIHSCKKEIRSNLHYDYATMGGQQRTHKYEVKNSFKDRYQAMVGDQLKTEILKQFKETINTYSTKEEITECVKKFKNSDEFKILATAQGGFTRAAHKLGLQSIIKTDSVKAVDKIFKEAINKMNNKKDDTPQGPSSGPG